MVNSYIKAFLYSTCNQGGPPCKVYAGENTASTDVHTIAHYSRWLIINATVKIEFTSQYIVMHDYKRSLLVWNGHFSWRRSYKKNN